MTTRVLVVDSAALSRRLISRALSALPEVEVVGTAANGRQALAQLDSLRPDLITLEMEMPETDGVEILKTIRQAGCDASVIMVSARAAGGDELAVRAREAGACDLVAKPQGGTPEENQSQLRQSLARVIQALRNRREIPFIPLRAPHSTRSISAPRAPAQITPNPGRGSPIVLIGVSTGGPVALAELLPALPLRLGAPVFVVQHMPAHFTGSLARRLQTQSAIEVKEAQDGEYARPDCVYLAPGGRQTRLSPGQNGGIVIRITEDPPENGCRPAVDYLFRSAARHFPGRSIAVILTGMGNDGTEGMRLLKRAGCLTIAQDEASCVIFGMPKEAIQAGVVDTVAPLRNIAALIVRAVAERRL